MQQPREQYPTKNVLVIPTCYHKHNPQHSQHGAIHGRNPDCRTGLPLPHNSVPHPPPIPKSMRQNTTRSGSTTDAPLTDTDHCLYEDPPKSCARRSCTQALTSSSRRRQRHAHGRDANLCVRTPPKSQRHNKQQPLCHGCVCCQPDLSVKTQRSGLGILCEHPSSLLVVGRASRQADFYPDVNCACCWQPLVCPGHIIPPPSHGTNLQDIVPASTQHTALLALHSAAA